MQSRRFSGLPLIGILAVIYFISGKLGLMLASLHASASPVWPPAGIALAALLVLGYRTWPAIFVGAFLVNVTTAGNVATSLAVASGNTLEAVCGAWLVNRFAGGTTVFDRPQGVFKFALAAVVSTIISPAVGVTSLALGGFADWTNYGAIWLTWWLGDTTGDLLIAPLIILWSIASKRRWNRREAVEAGILLLLLFVLGEAVFGGWLTISARNYPIGLISGPIVIWMAFRFAQRETATGIFILSAIAIWGTLHGFGPFVGEAENQSFLALQSWTAVLTTTAMALSAGMAERGRAEKALRESEARINLAANAAHLGLWHWNIQDNELWVTKKWRELFGFAESEPVYLDRLLEVVHPEDRERMQQVVQRMFEHREGEHENEYRITLPDGSTRWIAGYGTSELDERGKPAFARGVSRDITKRKIAEEELRESEARFRTVADSAPVLIWMSGPDKLCTFFNKGWLDFTGRTIEQELGKGWTEGVHADDLDRCLEVYENSFNARQPFTMEYRLRRNDGEYRWLLDNGTPRFASDGAFLGYIGSCIGITERKLAEEEVRLHREEISRLTRLGLLGEMAASIAHELNQPLSGIVSNASAGQRFIDRGDADLHKLREIMVDITADGRRAGEVIRNIRNIVKRGATSRQRLNLNDVVMSVAHMVHPDALAHSFQLKTSLAKDLPTIEADPVQIQQVLINLIGNAFDAMRDTPVRRRKVEVATERNDDGMIRVSVRDHGAGIPDEARERLFEQFFSTKKEGLGMGLAIVRSIIEAHGGTIAAENVEGEGARFYFTLPASEASLK